jgi:Fe-S cluster assembly iron-binding protein IscA
MVALNERARPVICRLVNDSKDTATALDIVFDNPNVGANCSCGKSFSL